MEEKRRVLATLDHDAQEWDTRHTAQLKLGADPLSEGRAVYAAKQAAVRRRIASKFTLLWATPLTTAAPAASSPVVAASLLPPPTFAESAVVDIEDSDASAEESESDVEVE